jgi:hypothetical protein
MVVELFGQKINDSECGIGESRNDLCPYIEKLKLPHNLHAFYIIERITIGVHDKLILRQIHILLEEFRMRAMFGGIPGNKIIGQSRKDGLGVCAPPHELAFYMAF